nr:hypothetical protein CFP56_18591 [Quercus suber]
MVDNIDAEFLVTRYSESRKFYTSVQLQAKHKFYLQINQTAITFFFKIPCYRQVDRYIFGQQVSKNDVPLLNWPNKIRYQQ